MVVKILTETPLQKKASEAPLESVVCYEKEQKICLKLNSIVDHAIVKVFINTALQCCALIMLQQCLLPVSKIKGLSLRYANRVKKKLKVYSLIGNFILFSSFMTKKYINCKAHECNT